MTPMATTSESLSPMAARLLKRGQKESQSGNADAAMRSLTSALALAPDNAEIMRWMGIAAQNLGDHAGAAELYRQILEGLDETHYERGLFEMRLAEEEQEARG